jgi:pimeloyl-ACP methyl ester carboxylesterase
MNVYFISGLGADSRAFQFLSFPGHIVPVFLDWLTPLPKETMQQYARRLAADIDTSRPFALAGLSFGGMLATEMLDFLQPQKTILISSVARRQELPFYYRWAGRIGLNKILPAKITNRPNLLTFWLMGLYGKAQRPYLKQVLTHTNTTFSRWAVNEIVNWKRTMAPSNIIRIHGTRDKVLPRNRFKADITIAGGGHLMVADRAAEISRILANLLRMEQAETA